MLDKQVQPKINQLNRVETPLNLNCGFSKSDLSKIFVSSPEKPKNFDLGSSQQQDESYFFRNLMENANKLAALFEGIVLTDKTLSICKAQETVKFRCKNLHVFYKCVDSIKIAMKNATGRKLSASTAASSSTSSDEDAQDAAAQFGCWCPKCEAFYSSCKSTAKSSGFRLVGKLYSDNLAFRCPDRKHCTPISYNKRISQLLSCADCRRESKEAIKEQLRREEEQQNNHISQMQEEMFRRAREEMEKELFNHQQQKTGAYTSYQQFTAYSQKQAEVNETERLAAIEKEVNKTAMQMMKAFIRDNINSSLQRDQIYIVYKFLNTPPDVLVSGMKQMQPTQLTQFYRKLAKQLHPDKNCHPQAKEAF